MIKSTVQIGAPQSRRGRGRTRTRTQTRTRG